MVDYRRMGNMEQHLANVTSTTSLHQLRGLWKSPRGIVLRIEALAVVAIIITFFLAAFGSCRRWSNRWIVQKGFFAAHALSLSLGTYSIGLMQSSSVKSDMYPVWTVSLFVLFGCIDPVTDYYGLDYKGPLSKMVYGICLNFGYVLLMSISTISSSGAGNTAIVMLSTITFVKGFHRSLALVQQKKMRNMVQHEKYEYDQEPAVSALRNEESRMIVDFPTGISGSWDGIDLADIREVLKENKHELRSCSDVCVAFSLSHELQRHFVGLNYRVAACPETLNGIDYKWALKVIEVELAFVYEGFFTGNAFLHYYQAKTASLWALASFAGICFVVVAIGINGTRVDSRRTGPDSSIKVVDTTTGDLVITFSILVSLALLQLMHLIRCWTSNWARVAIACAYARKQKQRWIQHKRPYWWLRLKAFVATSTNWFDKYLWQNKIGQYSILPEGRLSWKKESERGSTRCLYLLLVSVGLVKTLGLNYVWEVLQDLLGSDTSKRPALRLDDDVKASIIDFLGQIKTDRLDGNWLSLPNNHQSIEPYLPYYEDAKHRQEGSTSCIMMWHVATWFCNLAEQEKKDSLISKAEEHTGCRGAATSHLKRAAAAVTGCCFKEAADVQGETEENRRHLQVANALSKYCAYMVKSAPELLPGTPPETKLVYNKFDKEARNTLHREKDSLLRATSDPEVLKDLCKRHATATHGFWRGVGLARLLIEAKERSDPWETLALVWVRMLVYVAPYGNVEAHMRLLPQGGEFITHIWALLYHLDIRQWKLAEMKLHDVTNIDEAERILTEDGLAVVAYLDSLTGSNHDELATASRLDDGVRFYQTSNPAVAELFHIDPAAKRPVLVLLNKEDFTLYDGKFHVPHIAAFVSTNKLSMSKARAQSSEGRGRTEEIN